MVSEKKREKGYQRPAKGQGKRAKRQRREVEGGATDGGVESMSDSHSEDEDSGFVYFE
jgi:hypothetical protein